MRTLISIYSHVLEQHFRKILKSFSLSILRNRNFWKARFPLFLQSKYFLLLKDSFILVTLFFPLAAGLFINDFIHDQREIRKTREDLEESLLFGLENHAQLLSHLRDKIAKEGLYHEELKLIALFQRLKLLTPYSSQLTQGDLTGLRWIRSNLKAIGAYGIDKDFRLNEFLPFFKVLETLPDHVHLTKLGSQCYMGMAIKTGEDNAKQVKGFLLIPISLFQAEAVAQSLQRFVLNQVSLNFNLPSTGATLKDIVRTPFSFFNIHQQIAWRIYIFNNIMVYSIFLLFCCLILFLKKRRDRTKENELSLSQKKIHAFRESLLTQKSTAALLLHHVHNTVGSITELSRLLLETKSQPSSNVFSEKEQTNLMRKIYEAGFSLEESMFRKKKEEIIHISKTIDQCLSFYASKIEEESIQVRKNYGFLSSNFSTDKDAFYQLMLNLLSKVLERLPEQGCISIQLQEEKENLFLLTIEDNGYPFTPETLKSFKSPDQDAFKKYFDLDWEQILKLARSIKCCVSFEKLSSGRNRMTVQAQKHESKIEPSYGNNVIKLVRPS